MYVYELPFCSRLPREVTSYLTLIHPFDGYTWIMTLVASTTLFVSLAVSQALWTCLIGKPFHIDYLYQGKALELSPTIYMHPSYVMCCLGAFYVAALIEISLHP